MQIQKILIFILMILMIVSCTKKVYQKRIDAYLNASTVEEKEKYMADNYRSFFMDKKDSGDDKSSSLASFQNWDAPLHPDVKILDHSVADSVWTIKFNEQNDFSKLIGFPGWKATYILTFNSKRLIQETIYIPDTSNPSYKKWLQPAVDWLQQNKPSELSEVYKNGKLVQTEVTAKKWVSLLTLWRESTKVN